MKPQTTLMGLLVLLVVGCQNLTPSGAIRIHAQGTYQHSLSALDFPEEVGDFRRVVINQYDRFGENLGVGYNYNDPFVAVIFTVFVYRPMVLQSGRNASLEEQFEKERENILLAHRGGIETRSGPAANGEGFLAEYQYEDWFGFRRQPVVSWLSLFQQEGWIIKYRLTYPAAREEDNRPIAERFLQMAPWVRSVPEAASDATECRVSVPIPVLDETANDRRH